MIGNDVAAAPASIAVALTAGLWALAYWLFGWAGLVIAIACGFSIKVTWQ